MAIRMVEARDRCDWEQMWLGYQQYYEVDLSSTTKNTWQRLLSPPPQGPYCLVCEGEGGLIAFTTYLFHGHTWQPEPRCYLIDLYTKPELRGKRVGRRLIEAVYEKADAHGCASVYWLTQDFNPREGAGSMTKWPN